LELLFFFFLNKQSETSCISLVIYLQDWNCFFIHGQSTGMNLQVCTPTSSRSWNFRL